MLRKLTLNSFSAGFWAVCQHPIQVLQEPPDVGPKAGAQMQSAFRHQPFDGVFQGLRGESFCPVGPKEYPQRSYGGATLAFHPPTEGKVVGQNRGLEVHLTRQDKDLCVGWMNEWATVSKKVLPRV